jgi:hypothetical protein
MWGIAAQEKAFGLYTVGRWKLEGKPKRKGGLTRTIAGISHEVSIHIIASPRFVKNQGLFCFKRVFFEQKNVTDALIKVA